MSSRVAQRYATGSYDPCDPRVSASGRLVTLVATLMIALATLFATTAVPQSAIAADDGQTNFDSWTAAAKNIEDQLATAEKDYNDGNYGQAGTDFQTAHWIGYDASNFSKVVNDTISADKQKELLQQFTDLEGLAYQQDQGDAIATKIDALTAEINGHTVSVKALLRGQYTLRILYDVDNARGMEGDDLVWDTANFTLYKPKGASERKWDYGASNVDVGPISGYAVGPWDGRYEASENDTLSCFVDIPLLYEKGNNRTLYIGDLTNYSAKASVKITLPDAPPTLTVDVKKTIALKGGHWFHYDMTDEEAEQYPDATFDIQEVRIEPLAVSVIGKNHGSLPLGDTSRYDVQSRVKLFRADGTELTYGWDGEFYKGSYGRENKNSGQMTLRVDSYDILDPEAVAWVEIDGERFEVE